MKKTYKAVESYLEEHLSSLGYFWISIKQRSAGDYEMSIVDKFEKQGFHDYFHDLVSDFLSEQDCTAWDYDYTVYEDDEDGLFKAHHKWIINEED